MGLVDLDVISRERRAGMAYVYISLFVTHKLVIALHEDFNNEEK